MDLNNSSTQATTIFEKSKSSEEIFRFLAIEELRYDKEKIIKFSNISAGEFEFTISTLDDEIELISEDNYKQMINEAKELSPHEKDVPYFALALAYEYPIWSDEKDFKKQSKVKILTTEELIKIV